MEKLIEKYAELVIKKGVNVKEGQIVVIRSSTETIPFVRMLTKQAYLSGAKKVYAQFNDDYINKYKYKYQDLETLTDIESWVVEQSKYFVEQDACFISITSPVPGLNSGLDGNKIKQTMIASQKAMPFFQNHLMANKTQWTVVGAPNKVWAKKVFPKLDEKQAYEELWKYILKTARVDEYTDVIKVWDEHNKNLRKHNDILNEYNFKQLHFTNSLGTDLIVELVKDHIWAGGEERSADGTLFNPNIPTEETFTMPYKYGTRGKVYATKPLNFQGKLIENFYLEFKDGKVVNFKAEKEEDALKQLLTTDEGSSYIGEIALISHDSPISNTNVLFYNTLYDENASCHMALGKAYSMNVKGGTTMTPEQLVEKGANDSLLHVDFMFGSEDMKIVGLTQDNKKIVVFDNGNFVI